MAEVSRLFTYGNRQRGLISDDLLNDQHINNAKILLHHQLPLTEGLHNTLLQKKNQQQKIKCRIRIIHDSGNHGLLLEPLIVIAPFQFMIQFISTVNAKTIDVVNNIFVILDETKTDFNRMQIQKGSQYCGLFAITTATALLNGLDMPQITFCQDNMRQHLISCFTATLLMPYPTTN